MENEPAILSPEWPSKETVPWNPSKVIMMIGVWHGALIGSFLLLNTFTTSSLPLSDFFHFPLNGLLLYITCLIFGVWFLQKFVVIPDKMVGTVWQNLGLATDRYRIALYGCIALSLTGLYFVYATSADINRFFNLMIDAPLTEEFFFRGMLFTSLAKLTKSIKTAALISSVVWAVLHFDQGVVWVCMVVGIGYLFCSLYYYTKCLWTTIFCHMFLNGATLYGTTLSAFIYHNLLL